MEKMAIMKVAMANIQKDQGHHANSARSEEKTAPTIAPPGAVEPKRLNAMFFLLPGLYVRPRMAIALGSKIAGPIPWSALITLKNFEPWFPGVTYTLSPARRLKRVKHSHPKTKTFL